MGEVTKDNFFSSLPSEIDFSKTTILCDIEGGEFDFFTEDILKKVRNSNIIIEIHKNNKKHLEIELLERSKKFFNISIINDNNKNFENISELHKLNDIDRNLLSSEGRSYIGKWWQDHDLLQYLNQTVHYLHLILRTVFQVFQMDSLQYML